MAEFDACLAPAEDPDDSPAETIRGRDDPSEPLADRGSISAAELIDKLILSLIDQFYSGPKVFSVTGDRCQIAAGP